MNDIFAFGKNDIALRATIFTLRVNGGSFGECPLPPYPAERGSDTRSPSETRLCPYGLRRDKGLFILNVEIIMLNERERRWVCSVNAG